MFIRSNECVQVYATPLILLIIYVRSVIVCVYCAHIIVSDRFVLNGRSRIVTRVIIGLFLYAALLRARVECARASRPVPVERQQRGPRRKTGIARDTQKSFCLPTSN